VLLLRSNNAVAKRLLEGAIHPLVAPFFSAIFYTKDGLLRYEIKLVVRW
jgi:hypothetical protein